METVATPIAIGARHAHALTLSDPRADASVLETASGRQRRGHPLSPLILLCALAGVVLARAFAHKLSSSGGLRVIPSERETDGGSVARNSRRRHGGGIR